MRLRRAHLVIGLVAALGAWQFGAGACIYAKAWLAQQLIASAWTRTLNGDVRARPWPWADTWPVARLRIDSLDVDLYVLADASGRSLAFGPGHVAGTAMPGAEGNSMIAGHRDTHFRFLRDLEPGAVISVQAMDGRVHSYRIAEGRIFDVRSEQLQFADDASSLTLLTCYPFDALAPGGPLRYAAIAWPVAAKNLTR